MLVLKHLLTIGYTLMSMLYLERYGGNLVTMTALSTLIQNMSFVVTKQKDCKGVLYCFQNVFNFCYKLIEELPVISLLGDLQMYGGLLCSIAKCLQWHHGLSI